MKATATQTKIDLNRTKVLKKIEQHLQNEQRKVELAILESKNAGELEALWQERDSPSEDEIREVEFNHRDNLILQWRAIEEALGRLQQESFGHCIDCGKKIATKRLLANPMVSRCLPCQTRIEGDRLMPSL